MRATDFLTEIERLSKDDYTGGKDELDIYKTPGEKKLVPLPGGSGLMYAIKASSYNTSTYVFIVDPNAVESKPVKDRHEFEFQYQERLAKWQKHPNKATPRIVAKLSIDDYDGPIPNAVQVGSITVDEDYRGKGLAKALYGIVLSIMKKTLVAGGEQTPGGRRNWISLTNIPGVEVKGFVRVPDEDLNFDPDNRWGSTEKDVDQTHDALMKLGGQFIAANKWSEYWAFDVLPGKGELKPAVKTVLNQLYDNGEAETGLYARWTG